MCIYVIDIVWKGVLYYFGLYSHEPKQWCPEGEWLYKSYSTNLHAIYMLLYSYKYHQRDESDNTHAATLAENTTTEIKINYIINKILDVDLSMIQMHTSAIMGSAALIIDLNNCINWLGGSKVYSLKVN